MRTTAPYLQVEVLQGEHAAEHADGQLAEAAAVQVQRVQLGEAAEGGGADGAQVGVVADVQLLQPLQAEEGARLDHADVVGVEPQHRQVLDQLEAGAAHLGWRGMTRFVCYTAGLRIDPFRPGRFSFELELEPLFFII